MTIHVRHLTADDTNNICAMQLAYKNAIGEPPPNSEQQLRLKTAIAEKHIHFFGTEVEGELVGICSVALVFSTFLYKRNAIFEDFYIKPEYRRQGIAKALTRAVFAALREMDVPTAWVGSAEVDIPMYAALGFALPLGTLLAASDDLTGE